MLTKISSTATSTCILSAGLMPSPSRLLSTNSSTRGRFSTSAGIVSFLDRGVPYDPLAKPDPDLDQPLQKRRRGGLGIYMVKQYMDSIEYEYRDGQNILTLKKTL